MAERGFFLADGVLSRLDSILESSAEIFPAGMMASVPSADKFSMPGGDGFYYSFLFEDFVGFVKLDWFKVDSGMRPFEVKVTKENSDFLREEFVSPLMRSFDSEIERQFLAKKSSFSSLRSVSKGEFEKIVGEDESFSEFVTLRLDVLQISPDDKKGFSVVLPKELVFSMLCARQYPETDTLTQSEIDGIVENFTQRKSVVEVADSVLDFDGSDVFDSSLVSRSNIERHEKEKEMCRRLSSFMELVAKKMYKTFHDYRGSEYFVHILYSSRFSDSNFAKSVRPSDFLVSARLGGKLVYMRFEKKFFARTFLNRKEATSSLEKIECDIFRNEFAVPTFDALKSVVEVRLKKYLIATAVSFADLSGKLSANGLDKSDSGFLVTFQLKFASEVSVADFYFPAEAVEMLESASAFASSDEDNVVEWQFPAGNMKNTDILLSSFVFDKEKFDSGKTFVLEKEIGDTVDIVRNSKLAARGEVFIKNGKKFIRVKEVLGTRGDEQV
ncbi:MAG: hypothetical protein IJ717_07590 [Treponema sp.]|nr:hypothetical protein [Treponema sp.]